MRTLTRWLRLFVLFAATSAAPFQGAFAAVAPSLGAAESFAVLGASTVTNTGPSVITGDLGLSPGTSITGFPPGTVVGGTTHATDEVAAQAQSDTTAAYIDLAGQVCTTTFDVPTDIGGLTLVPGVYCFASSAQLTGVLTLNAEGNADAVWIFKMGSTLTTASSSSVVLINGAQNCNVFWQVGSSATLGTSTRFVGHILALTSITLTTDARVSGSVLARNGAVTLDSNTVSTSACAAGSAAPTLGKTFSPSTIAEGGTSALNITLSNTGPTAAWLTAPLTDTLPDGVTIAEAPATNCDGTATAGTSTVSLSGGSVPANGSCLVSVIVTAASCGNYINTLAAGALQTSNGNNASAAAATLTVTCASGVTVGKEFAPSTIAAGDTSLINIYLSNSDDTDAVLTAPFTDTLPSGLTITGDFLNNCGGTITHTADSFTMTGGSIPANGSCIIGSGIPVTASVPGTYFNTLPAGALQTSNGSNAAAVVATLTVTSPPPPPPPPPATAPTLGNAFNAASINAGGNSTLTITLGNADATVASLTAPLTNTLPIGVTVAGTPGTTCGGTATAETSTVTLTGGSIPASGSCTITVVVTAASAGDYTNTLAAGALQTSNGSNADAAVASLTVLPVVTPPVDPPVDETPATGVLPAGVLLLFLLAAAARRRRAS